MTLPAPAVSQQPDAGEAQDHHGPGGWLRDRRRPNDEACAAVKGPVIGRAGRNTKAHLSSDQIALIVGREEISFGPRGASTSDRERTGRRRQAVERIDYEIEGAESV